jgi:CRISPR-associated protein Cmr3
MSITTLQLTPRDPIIARDGRPFGVGQGNRMRSLPWPLPSTVAGALRTALVKANPGLDFTGEMPRQLMAVEVAGVLPMRNGELYLPASIDCAWDEKSGKVFRLRPVPLEHGAGVDFPANGLDPVRLTEEQAQEDFKAKALPAWWPLGKYVEWLTTEKSEFSEDWFDSDFLNAAPLQTRDHVCLDPETGAAAEGQIFATAALNATHLPRFGVENSRPFQERFAEIKLSARVTMPEPGFGHIENFTGWHPLGGERRLVHCQQQGAAKRLWDCPDAVKPVLESATRVRMILATPAIFEHGWRPGWIDADTLTGRPFEGGPELKLAGVTNPRWKAVSGWAYQRVDDNGQLDPNGKRGPKPVRRMALAGSVYFFEKVDGDGGALASNGWLRSICDSPQDRNDGFGLTIWGTW